ncbi:MAG: type 2 isopentenyl-diphosphate Delta-isomerase [Deltaproteobacteria bacterium]|nr:type 2 isopentenyl-diphosphate Delta-isomerase [Deltaproteobacteria bacterium]
MLPETTTDPATDTTKRDPASKSAHIAHCLTPAVEYAKRAGFERYDFVHQALPELDLDKVDLGTRFLGKAMRAPLMVASMTGGTERARILNQRLGAAVEKHGLAMGVGSQRVGLEDPERAHTFQVRDRMPTALLFANIGAVQLAKGWTHKEARAAVKMIGADALFLHLNPIQEAAQGGDVAWAGLRDRIRAVVQELAADGIPVVAREVGFGMATETARQLVELGVAGIDCSGAGGTSWAKVEQLCAKTPRRAKMGAAFGEWGIPTVDSILNVRAASATIPLIATGGLRSGQHVAMALALGADLGAMARPFLVAADKGETALDEFIQDTLLELRIAMFGSGCADVAALKTRPVLRPGTAAR